MKRSLPLILAFGILSLFFIQSAGTLVESIYILDLMNTTLDEKALGVLFFFSPILLLPFYKKYPRALVWVTFAIGFLARGFLPFLKTENQVLTGGLAAFSALSLFLLLRNAHPKEQGNAPTGLLGSAGLALAIGLSAFLRTAGHGLDLSLTRTSGWLGWALGLCLGWALTQLDLASTPLQMQKKNGVTSSLLGIYLILTLVWFSFSAPSVIARWTEGNYTLIVFLISLLSLLWIGASLLRPGWLDRIDRRALLVWNLAFSLSLTVTILVHRVAFPPTPDFPAVVVTSPGWAAQIPLVLTLLLFPVLFLDMRIFLEQVRGVSSSQLVPGILLGGLAVILLVFSHIFTNVWGYVEPVSPLFRNLFWLPYFAMTGILTLLILGVKPTQAASTPGPVGSLHWGWGFLLGALFLATILPALPKQPVQVNAGERTSLVVMTYNIQQANDDSGERSYDRQLALIQKVSPDILALQESDSARISLNNNDYVRYYADHLGYYSYYGPTTVTGTYGTAILSKYPLLNTRAVFSYSDQDEIGTAEAEIEVNGLRFTIYDVHPDGSDIAMLTFAKSLLERSRDKPYVIALGDYNLRDYQEAYQLINSVYVNAWVSMYPSEIGADGTDMSGDNRIDHIFLSPSFSVQNAFYVLPPDSATDHPVHWAEIFWVMQ